MIWLASEPGWLPEPSRSSIWVGTWSGRRSVCAYARLLPDQLLRQDSAPTPGSRGQGSVSGPVGRVAPAAQSAPEDRNSSCRPWPQATDQDGRRWQCAAVELRSGRESCHIRSVLGEVPAYLCVRQPRLLTPATTLPPGNSGSCHRQQCHLLQWPSLPGLQLPAGTASFSHLAGTGHQREGHWLELCHDDNWPASSAAAI